MCPQTPEHQLLTVVPIIVHVICICTFFFVQVKEEEESTGKYHQLRPINSSNILLSCSHHRCFPFDSIDTALRRP